MAFSAFERTVALRHLRPHRQGGFVSVIALFSLLGIMLGVATLIIVMSVMNGFRQELLDRILGLNGHLGVQAVDSGPIPDFDHVVEGQVMATANGVAGGALVRGLRLADLRARPIIADGLIRGSLDDFEGNDAVLVGDKLARRLGQCLGGLGEVVDAAQRVLVVSDPAELRLGLLHIVAKIVLDASEKLQIVDHLLIVEAIGIPGKDFG